MTVANKLVHRGELEVSRKPSRREGRTDPACTCGHAPFAQFFWREGPGCSGHPVFPAPSVLKRVKSTQSSGECRREDDDVYPFGCASATLSPVIPATGSARSAARLRRGFSSPRPMGSSTGVSGILDRPVEPDDDSGVVGLACVHHPAHCYGAPAHVARLSQGPAIAALRLGTLDSRQKRQKTPPRMRGAGVGRASFVIALSWDSVRGRVHGK